MELIRIGSLAIDFDNCQIINSAGELIELRPQTFSVFSYLCRNRGRVVTKDELFENIWDRVVVTDDSIVKCISEIRKALDLSCSIELKTVARRGYLLTESISRPSVPDFENTELPTMAVIPFTALTKDTNIFSAGLTEDITTHLSSQKDLFVLASHSVKAYNMQHGLESIKKISDDLNVRYLLQGSIQKNDNTIRVNVQLCDARSNAQVWAERYEESNPNLFEVQDRICASIINRISGSSGVLISVERNQMNRNVSTDPKAYELYIMASNINKSLSKDGIKQSIELYNKAVSVDPYFSRAWIRLACLHLFSAACAYTDDIESTIERFIKSSLTAIELDSNDSLGQAIVASAYCFLGQINKARESFDRALSLGPNNADTLALVSYLRPTKFATRSKDLENIRKAKSLNPYFPMWYSLSHGYCAYHALEYQESIESLNQADASIPDTQLYLALSYAELGNREKTEYHLDQLKILNPDITISQLVEGDAMIDKTAVQHFCSSGIKAGIPE